MFFGHKPADAIRVKDGKAQNTESCDRRVMISPNSDGQAYSKDEFVEFFGDKSSGLREWEKAAPVHGSLFHQMERRSAPRLDTRSVVADKNESNDTFLDIKRALIRLLDEGEAADIPWRRRVLNAKLPRSALIWSRFVNKCLLFLRNDRTGRLCSDRNFAIGA